MENVKEKVFSVLLLVTTSHNPSRSVTRPNGAVAVVTVSFTIKPKYCIPEVMNFLTW
jgi:hypothetical protein